MTNRWKKMMKWIGLIIFIIIMLKIYYELKLVDLSLGIVQLEKRKKKIVLISNKSLLFITRKKESDEVVHNEMSKYGWSFVQQFGQGYVYSNGEEEILLKKKNYWIGYSVYEIYSDNNKDLFV